MNGYEERVEVQMVNFYRSLSEKDRRRYAAVEAGKLDHGGVAYIAELFGCDPDTIRRGMTDVEHLPQDAAAGASEKKGGRKKASSAEPELVPQLKKLVEHHTAGSAVEPGRVWTSHSCESFSEELAEFGFSVSANTVDRLLRNELGLSRRKMEKTLAMGENADREAQFQRMNQVKQYFLVRDWPVLSIDTKKKELLGRFEHPVKPGRTIACQPGIMTSLVRAGAR